MIAWPDPNSSRFTYPIGYKKTTTYFLKHVSSWGWGTWKKAWDLYNDDAHELLTKLHKYRDFNMNDYNSGFGNSFYQQLVSNAKGEMRTWAVR